MDLQQVVGPRVNKVTEVSIYNAYSKIGDRKVAVPYYCCYSEAGKVIWCRGWSAELTLQATRPKKAKDLALAYTVIVKVLGAVSVTSKIMRHQSGHG